MSSDTMPYTIPTAIAPIIAPPGPPAASVATNIGAIKANDEPKYAGTWNLVINKKNNVAIPLVKRAIAGDNSVNVGTKIVEPSMANICCKLNVIN